MPFPGRVLVRRGQKVNRADVIAVGDLSPQHIFLDVKRGLGLRSVKVEEYIQCQAGDAVNEGDVIAGPVGLARRVIRASRPGRVMMIRDGKVLLEVEGSPHKLRAGMTGVVVSLVPERGAVIEGTGALVQGVWGNEQMDFGLLHVLAKDPSEMLTVGQLDMTLRGSVLLAGYCGDEKVLRAAAELPLRGLILSSMASSLIPTAARMEYPIVVVEGFGRLPMNSIAFRLLSTSDQRETTLNAAPFDRYKNTRPEIIIPLPVTERPIEPQSVVEFMPDQRVRVVGAPYKSQIGTLVSLPSGMQVFPNKLRAAAAEVSLTVGKTVVLPLANLEVLAR